MKAPTPTCIMHYTETTWPSSNIHRHMSLPFPSDEGALLCMAIRCARPTKPKPLGTRVWAEWLCLHNDCTPCSQPLPHPATLCCVSCCVCTGLTWQMPMACQYMCSMIIIIIIIINGK